MTRSAPGRDRDDEGVTTIIVALMLVAILMFVGFAIDGGMAYVSHRTSQNASDAGAYAAVRVLDHLKFDANCTPTITPSCPFSSTTEIAKAAIEGIKADGGDPASTQCYLVDFSAVRVVDPLSGTTRDLCGGGAAAAADVGELSQAYGIEAWATVVRSTTFARVGSTSLSQTRASTHAVVMIQNFAGAQGSPFIVCGSTANPGAYNILDQTVVNGTTTYTVKTSVLNKYYALQASQAVPGCGADSDSFKGLAGNPLLLDQWNPTVPGTGKEANITEQILGTTPCTSAQVAAGDYNGCGVLLPIATQNTGTGSGVKSYLVIWTIWNAWGNGQGNGLNGAPAGCQSPELATDSSGNPIPIKGVVKYCGQLLGSYTVVAGGAGGGPPVAGGHAYSTSWGERGRLGSPRRESNP